ncbi:apolipoprotein N-acyltransferase [Rubritalea spongiae]
MLAVSVFAPFSWSTLALVAWVPMMMALTGASIKAATRLGLLHGVCLFGCTMGWLANVFQSMSWSVYPLVLVLAMFSAIFGLGYGLAQTRWKGGWKLASFGALWWGAVEFIRSELFVLKFSWMSPGLGFDPHFLTSVVGVYGMSVLIVLLGLLLVCLRKPWLGGMGLLVLLLTSFIPRSAPEGSSLRVLALQAEFATMLRYQELVDSCEEDIDVILFPEYALEVDPEQSDKMRLRLTELAAERSAIVIIGARTDLENGEHYNSAVVLNENGIIGKHHKNHPVHFFNDGKKGELAEPVVTSLGALASPICFDNDYEGVVRRMTQAGAEVFLVPSLDASHWGERQHYMHSELFRHRAAESRRWFVVASGSGMTQLIDPFGNRVRSLPIMEEGILYATVPKLSGDTFYTRIGWTFPWVWISTSALAIAYCLIKLLKAKTQ